MYEHNTEFFKGNTHVWAKKTASCKDRDRSLGVTCTDCAQQVSHAGGRAVQHLVNDIIDGRQDLVMDISSLRAAAMLWRKMRLLLQLRLVLPKMQLHRGQGWRSSTCCKTDIDQERRLWLMAWVWSW